jgi:hypothetical protein
MNPLLELADRVEAATGPDRELDIATQRIVRDKPGLIYGLHACPPYTASLDAAATLVPEGWDWSASGYGDDGASAEVWLHGWQDDTKINSFLASTAPLCLVAASLRAIASMGSSGQ